MSVELDVKVGSQAIPPQLFIEALSAKLHGFFRDVPDLFQTDGETNIPLGEAASSFGLRCGSNAAIFVRCSSIGTEEQWGDEGGWWVNFTVALRTLESFLLLIMASACFGKMVNQPVLDDWGMLRSGRFLDAAEVLGRAEPGRGLSFADAARVVCARLDVSFGDESTS